LHSTVLLNDQLVHRNRSRNNEKVLANWKLDEGIYRSEREAVLMKISMRNGSWTMDIISEMEDGLIKMLAKWRLDEGSL
jgi:stress response protein SCP2